jgi:hypothetical protein
MRSTAIFLISASTIAIASADVTLTDLNGRQAKVEVIEATPATITFTIAGRKGTMPLDQLSADSRAAAIEYAKSKNVYRSFPSFSMQVKIGYKRRNDDATWYIKKIWITPSFSIEGTSKLTGLPAAEACMILVTRDTREKYVNHVDKLTVAAAQTIPIPAAGSGDRREFSFQTLALSLDTAQDSSNVGGDEYKYYVFGLRDPETHQLIAFETDCAQLATNVTKAPEMREKMLALHPGDAFSPAEKSN